MSIDTTPDLDHLRSTVGRVVGPADPEWDVARGAWNLAVDQRPAAVAMPRDAAEVAAVVRTAGEMGLRVAAQGTGHNAGPLGSLAETILVKTSAIRGVSVDPARRRARAGAGALWREVVGPAGDHGLAALSGSSSDVGVVGYSLGGGIGWLSRRYGLQANSVTAVEVVTTGGELVRVDRDHGRDLFWALRGGGGNFGVVTALELALHPVREVHAGMLVWDWTYAGDVLARFVDWAAMAPESVTTSCRILQYPAVPRVPEPLRGRRVAMIDGAVAAPREVTDVILAPLRELRPEIDTFRATAPADLIRLHGDPEEPVPVASDTATLADMPAAAIDAFVAAAGPGSGSPLLVAELRQLGGALGMPAQEHGALPSLDGRFVLVVVGIAANPALAAMVRHGARRVFDALAPWDTGRRCLNFAGNAIDASTGYDPACWERLRAVKAAVDPGNVFQANHPIAPAG